MKMGPFLDVGYQWHGAALLVRSGNVSLVGAILLVVSGVVGELLAFFGTFAPEEMQDVLGPFAS